MHALGCMYILWLSQHLCSPIPPEVYYQQVSVYFLHNLCHISQSVYKTL